MKHILTRLVVVAAGASLALGASLLPATAVVSKASPMFPPPAPDIQNADATIKTSGAAVSGTSCTGASGGSYTEFDTTGWSGVSVDNGSLQTPLNGTLTANVTMVGDSNPGSPWIMTGDLTLVDANGFPVFAKVPFTFPGELVAKGVVRARGEITPLLYGTYTLLANVTLTADLNSNQLFGSLGSSASERMYAVEWNGQTCNSGGKPDVGRASAKFALKLKRAGQGTKCPGLQQHLTVTVANEIWTGNQSNAGSSPIPLNGPLNMSVGYTVDTVTNLAVMHLKGTKATSGAALGYSFNLYAPATQGAGNVTSIGELVGAFAGGSGYTLYANIRVIDTGASLGGAFGLATIGAQPLTSREWNGGFCAPF